MKQLDKNKVYVLNENCVTIIPPRFVDAGTMFKMDAGDKWRAFDIWGNKLNFTYSEKVMKRGLKSGVIEEKTPTTKIEPKDIFCADFGFLYLN